MFFCSSQGSCSAFVSLFVTFGLGPIAGFLAKKIQDVQTVKMKKVTTNMAYLLSRFLKSVF